MELYINTGRVPDKVSIDFLQNRDNVWNGFDSTHGREHCGTNLFFYASGHEKWIGIKTIFLCIRT